MSDMIPKRPNIHDWNLLPHYEGLAIAYYEAVARVAVEALNKILENETATFGITKMANDALAKIGESGWEGMSPLLTGAEVVADAVDVALVREAARLAKLAGVPPDQLPTEEQRAEAVKLVKRRLIAILEWRP